jgi:hypothetical protein
MGVAVDGTEPVFVGRDIGVAVDCCAVRCDGVGSSSSSRLRAAGTEEVLCTAVPAAPAAAAVVDEGGAGPWVRTLLITGHKKEETDTQREAERERQREGERRRERQRERQS